MDKKGIKKVLKEVESISRMMELRKGSTTYGDGTATLVGMEVNGLLNPGQELDVDVEFKLSWYRTPATFHDPEEGDEELAGKMGRHLRRMAKSPEATQQSAYKALRLWR